MMEARLLLATLFRQWRVRRADHVTIGTVSSIPLRPSAPIRVVLEKRAEIR